MATTRRSQARGNAALGPPHVANEGGGDAADIKPERARPLLSAPRSITTQASQAELTRASNSPAANGNEARQCHPAGLYDRATIADPPDRKSVVIKGTPAAFETAAAAATVLAITAQCTLEARLEHMVASEQGGPRASGQPTVAQAVTYALLETVIAAVEAVFLKHGSDKLRANCGGLLAREVTRRTVSY